MQTAKANNLKLYEYLRQLISVMMEYIFGADTAYLEDLMPWPENLPDICKKTPLQNAGNHIRWLPAFC